MRLLNRLDITRESIVPPKKGCIFPRTQQTHSIVQIIQDTMNKEIYQDCHYSIIPSHEKETLLFQPKVNYYKSIREHKYS